MNLKSASEEYKLSRLSKEQLAVLLKSTYEYKPFFQYFEEHDLVFLDKLYQNKKGIKNKEALQPVETADCQILKQLDNINQEEGLHLHKYHQDLIFNKFKKYYRQYQEKKVNRLKSHYENLISKAERNLQSSLPQQLVQVCLQKEKELVMQAMRKKNKTLV